MDPVLWEEALEGLIKALRARPGDMTVAVSASVRGSLPFRAWRFSIAAHVCSCSRNCAREGKRRETGTIEATNQKGVNERH